MLNSEQKTAIISRLSLISIGMVMGLNLVIVLIGYYIDNNQLIQPINNISLIRNILFLFGLSEIAAIYFIRKSQLSKIKIANSDFDGLSQKLFSLTIIISALCIAISIYGLVLLFLGEEFRIMILFVAISLTAYQLFRLRNRDLDKIDQ